jgi:hypothetical protein
MAVGLVSGSAVARSAAGARPGAEVADPGEVPQLVGVDDGLDRLGLTVDDAEPP